MCASVFPARFNSRPCEGATLTDEEAQLAPHVSIHAPVKERPAIVFTPGVPFVVSIHAPVKERPRPIGMQAVRKRFNSRPCEGATFPVSLLNQRLWFQFTPL